MKIQIPIPGDTIIIWADVDHYRKSITGGIYLASKYQEDPADLD